VQTRVNLVLMFAVAIPWIVAVYLATAYCDPNREYKPFNHPAERLCFSFLKLPIRFLNVLFFFAIDLTFWFLSVLQHTCWLIDPYWTFIPLMIETYFQYHPLANPDPSRGSLACFLVWFWSFRLTHSYFRREEWKIGQREDWRFAGFRKDYSHNWWWMSFFICYLSQHVFLVGICLPLYAIFFANVPLNNWDYVATAICVIGVTGAYYADTQLFNFMKTNEKAGKKVPVLNTGLWHYSRHPNYFFEQVWWWGLWIFAWNLGYGWMAIGPFLNSACLYIVSFMVESKMLEKKERRFHLKEYFDTTSRIIPWFKRKSKMLPKED
jgi:steroid 5-alpha reductase family enzyme